MTSSTSLHNLSSDIALELKKHLPDNTISASKVKDCISKVLDSNPSELSFLLKLHDKHIEFGTRMPRGIVCTFYNIQENSAELGTFEYSDNKLKLYKKDKINFENEKSTKNLFKSLQKYSNATALNTCWLICPHKNFKDVEKFTADTIKDTPPNTHVKKVRFSFTRDDEVFSTKEEKSPFSFNLKGAVTNEDNALGVVFRTHTPPYLPIQINYFVGNLDNPDLNFLNIEESNIDMSELEIRSQLLTTLNKVKSVPLKKVNLLTLPFKNSSVVFDLLHLGLKHNFEEIKKTYQFSTTFGREKKQPLMPLNRYSELLGHTPDTSGQKYKLFDSDTIFEKDFFEARVGIVKRVDVEIDSFNSCVKNPLQKAIKFKKLLEQVI